MSNLSQTYAIKREKMWGSTWKRGDTIYGREKDGTWFALVCLKPRVIGPRGGVREPEHNATITAPTWRGIRQGFARLGFNPPVRRRG